MNNVETWFYEVVRNFHRQSGLRKGQMLMNALSTVRPNLYGEVTGTDKDPFYTDDNLGRFKDYITERWN